MKKIKKSKKKKLIAQDLPIVRYQTDKEHGLSEEQINERTEHKLINDTKIRTSNSYLAIICKNIFTIFNMIWLFIAIALMSIGAWTDLLFLFVVIANTAISIIQEIKAKNMVEKLSMVSAPKIKVIRTGLQYEIKGEELLLDDIVILENGNQIPADCTIVDGIVEANESLLTGESNLIKKTVGDTLLAGSFLVSGLCYARVDKVGKDNYIQTVAEQTKDFKPQTSNLFKDLNNLIKIIILILIPIGVLTYVKEIFLPGASIASAIKGTSGALTGMIPAGMYLLITIGLSVGVIKLARKKTLVKNLYSIEMLARANVLCLDKTGTITDGTMNVLEVLPQNGASDANIQKIMKAVLACQQTMNATSVALVDYFGKDTKADAKEVIEFSSQRKYSATTLKNGKTYFIGAAGFIKCEITTTQKKQMTEQMEKGYRIISLVETNGAYNEKNAGKDGKLLAFFVLEDHIRKDAIETIAWFKKNNVDVKIISGDDALTVSKIAKRVGIDDCDRFISLENMSLTEVAQIANKFTVFGRVTPEQKHTIIKTLKTQGNVVAMTGDGVNDTLALKEANCSIAMADGSEVARNISHLVLMESNFSALPAIVKEGRQIVNNVQKSSVLYLMKTLFTMMLCFTTLLFQIKYPFTPKQMLLLEMFVIGVPSFILTFQPNNELIRGNFIPQVLKKAIPCALVLFVNMIVVIAINSSAPTLNENEFQTLCSLTVTFLGLVNLFWICYPFNWLKWATVGISAFLILFCLTCLPKGLLTNAFGVSEFSFPVIATLLALVLVTSMIIVGLFYLKEWYFKHRKTKKHKTEKETKPKMSLWERMVAKLSKDDTQPSRLEHDSTVSVTSTSWSAEETQINTQIMPKQKKKTPKEADVEKKETKTEEKIEKSNQTKKKD